MSYLAYQASSTQFTAKKIGFQQVLKMSESGAINPLALTVADASKLLSIAGGRAISTGQIEADVATGAPTNEDGTINLVTYAAWLVREHSRGD